MNALEATAAGYEVGQVKWFDPERKYGFIVPDSGDDDVFMHFSSVRDIMPDLAEGRRIGFTPYATARGISAKTVILLDEV